MSKIHFHNIYTSMIADPLTADATYTSVLPSWELRPYIRCFWGSARDFDPFESIFYGNTLIVPDTCFDLMLIKDKAANSYRMIFLGMDNTPRIDQWDEADRDLSLFAIRFPFWVMHLICGISMKDTMGQANAPEDFFPGVKELCEKIFEQSKFAERIRLAEKYVENLIDGGRLNASFFNGVDLMLQKKGRVTLDCLSAHLGYSHRQTQRIFLDMTGLSPKQMTDLVRYQSLWQEILKSGSIVYQDLVYTYGYTDQSHLIADFKKYHSMTPREALNNVKHGGR